MQPPKIFVISLGPGDPGFLTLQAADMLRSKKYRIVLRTAKHPVASWLTSLEIVYESMDAFYDRYDDFEQMHQAMSDWLWQEAQKNDLCFCVIDFTSERVLAYLKKDKPSKGILQIIPGVSAMDQCIASLPPQLSSVDSLQIFTAVNHQLQQVNPSRPLLITELDSAFLAGDIKLLLAEFYEDEQIVFFFPPSESRIRPVKAIPLYQIDSQNIYDHTTAVFIPGLDYLHRSKYTFDDLFQIVSRLRAPGGCPWDSVQTHESLRPYMVEEAWEAVNAIEDGDMDHLADELGDVLFQVFIHASIAQSYDEFRLTDVVSGICNKMIHRHPHVFNTEILNDAQDAAENWEKIKSIESGCHSVGDSLNDISQSLPALKYAIKIFKRLSQIPAWRDRTPKDIASEIQKLSTSILNQDDSLCEENMTRILMKFAELCYHMDCDAEVLLHHGVKKLTKAYQQAEKAILVDEKNPENLTFQQLRVYLNSVENEIV